MAVIAQRQRPLERAGQGREAREMRDPRLHGHQFRSYNADLGDGRGFLFAQVHDRRDGRLLDFGTKGSGTTPWSRSADGRLTLKGATAAPAPPIEPGRARRPAPAPRRSRSG
jgi:hypothetical protein